MPPSAISGTPVSPGGRGAVEHGRELRHADPCDEPCRAREAGPDADLDRVGAGGGEVATPSPVATLPATTSTSGQAAFSSCDRLDRGVGVTVGDVEHERVDLGLDERLRSIEVVAADPDRRRDAQAALRRRAWRAGSGRRARGRGA